MNEGARDLLGYLVEELGRNFGCPCRPPVPQAPRSLPVSLRDTGIVSFPFPLFAVVQHSMKPNYQKLSLSYYSSLSLTVIQLSVALFYSISFAVTPPLLLARLYQFGLASATALPDSVIIKR